MVEFSFDRDEFRPDPADRRREAERREERERRMDEERQRDAFLDDQRREMEEDARREAVRRVVNDPGIGIDPTLLQVINDPNMVMDRDMVVRRRRSSSPFASQFRLDKILPRKRTRKKTKTDKNMSKALRAANERLRTKNGKLRKGKTQADVMRLAHRLRKKM